MLAGKKIIITAGGTQEPLDPVRVLTNRSSGRQGYALAQAALDMGAHVTLVTTPTSLTPPIGARVVNVETAKQMLEAVLEESAESDALIMAAAVADFRPKNQAKDKIKKESGIPQIELEATEDILKTVGKAKRVSSRSGTAARRGGVRSRSRAISLKTRHISYNPKVWILSLPTTSLRRMQALRSKQTALHFYLRTGVRKVCR